jgi:hypothetical protein
MMRRIVGIASVLGLALSTLMLLGTGPAFACSCVVATTAQHIEQADLVFTGEVVAVKRDRQTATYAVRANRVFKGELLEQDVTIESASSGSSCGIDLPESEPAVFFVNTAADSLQANACGGTTLSTAALEGEVTAALGAGQAPPGSSAAGAPAADPDADGSALFDVGTGELALAVGLGILALVAAVGFGVLASRRRRS